MGLCSSCSAVPFTTIAIPFVTTCDVQHFMLYSVVQRSYGREKNYSQNCQEPLKSSWSAERGGRGGGGGGKQVLGKGGRLGNSHMKDTSP